MAKHKGLSGWHSMRKDELVRALVRAAQKRARLRATAVSSRHAKPSKSLRRSQIKTHPIKTHAAHANGSKVNGTSKANGKTPHGDHRSHRDRGSLRDPGGRRPTARQLRIAERIHRVNAERERLKDLSGAFTLAKSGGKRKAPERDRLVV